MTITPAHKTTLEIARYIPGASSVKGKDKVIKLSSNENPLGCSPRVFEAIGNISRLDRYPDGSHGALRKALAEKHGLDVGRIVCGNGSGDILLLLAHAFATEGANVMSTEHSFLLYDVAAKQVGAEFRAIPLKDYNTDVDALINAADENTRLVYIANPHNPTGTYLNKDELTRLHAGLPSSTLLVIDNAYAEYVTEVDFSNGLELAKQHDNVLCSFTFSKVYGMAALRLGWAYASEEVIDVLDRIRGPFNVNQIAMLGGLAALEDDAFIAQTVAHNKSWAKKLTDAFTSAGYIVPESHANFILVIAGKKAEKLDAHYREQGILVRHLKGYQMHDGVRITIGTVEECEAVIKHIVPLADL